MDILPILIDIGFKPTTSNNGFIFEKYYDSGIIRIFYTYMKDTNGLYNLIKQADNFVPIRFEVKEKNKKLIYDFISTEFGKEYIRDYKLNEIIKI